MTREQTKEQLRLTAEEIDKTHYDWSMSTEGEVSKNLGNTFCQVLCDAQIDKVLRELAGEGEVLTQEEGEKEVNDWMNKDWSLRFIQLNRGHWEYIIPIIAQAQHLRNAARKVQEGKPSPELIEAIKKGVADCEAGRVRKWDDIKKDLQEGK